MKPATIAALMLPILVLSGVSCALRAPFVRSPGGETRSREAIAASAQALLGQPPNAKVTVRGRAFTLDCIGTVYAAYWGAGLDITGNPGHFSGNGVSILYHNFEASGGILENGEQPRTGDIIFWDNTWDRNGNGVFGDDPLTHAGLVMQVDRDGTVHYLHSNYSKGVIIEVMNLRFPDRVEDSSGKRLNSGLYLGARQGSPANPPRWLAGDLFKALGNAEAIAEKYGN